MIHIGRKLNFSPGPGLKQFLAKTTKLLELHDIRAKEYEEAMIGKTIELLLEEEIEEDNSEDEIEVKEIIDILEKRKNSKADKEFEEELDNCLLRNVKGYTIS